MAVNKTLKIDKEFESLIRPLNDDEFGWLEDSVKEDGCIDPIVVWEDTIVDGHHRYKICTKNNIDFELKYIDFQNREEALDWIDIRQIGRRNLTKDDFKNIVGRVYNRRTKRKEDNLKKGIEAPKGQNDPSENTAEEVADQFGVSPRTVRRAAKFNEKVEEVKQKEPDIDQDAAYKKAKKELKPKKIKCLVCNTEHSEKKKCPKCEKAKEDLKQIEQQNIGNHESNIKDVAKNGGGVLNEGGNNEMEIQGGWLEPDLDKEKEVKIEENHLNENKGVEVAEKDFAMRHAKMAVAQLKAIKNINYGKQEAFDYVINWINTNR
jgi:ParB-like chromosome segregation protein Spo0J